MRGYTELAAQGSLCGVGFVEEVVRMPPAGLADWTISLRTRLGATGSLVVDADRCVHLAAHSYYGCFGVCQKVECLFIIPSKDQS